MDITKGEWKVTREGLVWAKQNDGLQFHHRIALIEDSNPNRIANARLISAAPELYEALEMAVRVLRDNDLDESMAGEFEILTDALAKVES